MAQTPPHSTLLFANDSGISTISMTALADPGELRVDLRIRRHDA